MTLSEWEAGRSLLTLPLLIISNFKRAAALGEAYPQSGNRPKRTAEPSVGFRPIADITNSGRMSSQTIARKAGFRTSIGLRGNMHAVHSHVGNFDILAMIVVKLP